MKTTIISLFLIGLTPIMLCNCAHKTRTTAAKSSAVTVRTVDALAPQSVKGKTIVLNYTNSKLRDITFYERGTEYSSWRKHSAQDGCVVNSYEFPSGNSGVKEGGDITYTYSKISATMAKIEGEAYHESGFSYELNFTSPNGGYAKEMSYCEGDAGTEVTDISFTIK